jgi:hypothetical protein
MYEAEKSIVLHRITPVNGHKYWRGVRSNFRQLRLGRCGVADAVSPGGALRRGNYNYSNLVGPQLHAYPAAK